MAQLKLCESEEEFMNAWKAGLLVDSDGESVLSYETHCEWYPTNSRDTVYQANKRHTFILVEDEED